MTTPYEQLDRWVDAHFAEEVRFLQALVQVPTDTPPGRNAPHAERTAELLAEFGLDAEAPPGAGRRGRGLRARLADQPDRAAPPRRRPDDRPQRARRRRAARRRLDPRPVRRRGRRRQAVRPRLGGQQERLRDLHLRAARARGAEAAAEGRGRAALHLRRGVRRRARPRLAAPPRPDQARPAARGRLQLPGRHRAQRLPADGSDGARQDGARGDPEHRHRRAAGRGRDPERAVCAEHAVPAGHVEGRGHHAPVPQRRPHRGRHQHQRRPGQGRLQARPPDDPGGRPGRGRGRRSARSSPRPRPRSRASRSTSSGCCSPTR